MSSFDAEALDAEADYIGHLIESSVLKEYIPSLCSTSDEPFITYYDSDTTGEIVVYEISRQEYFNLTLCALHLLSSLGIVYGERQIHFFR